MLQKVEPDRRPGRLAVDEGTDSCRAASEFHMPRSFDGGLYLGDGGAFLPANWKLIGPSP